MESTPSQSFTSKTETSWQAPIRQPVPGLDDPDVGSMAEDIAVIGLSVKFPQDADTTAGFWKLMMEARSARTEIPLGRWNVDAFHSSTPRPGTMNTRGAHFIKEDLAAFDASFFSISAPEAACMDPQQRILLETSYRALENAGLSLSEVSHSNTSVYVGCSSREHEPLLMRDGDFETRYSATGTGYSLMANRISWFFGLQGTSLCVDTYCSSSLLAVHLACQSIRAGESSMALVGGSNIIESPDMMSQMGNLNLFSPDGRCYSFDHRANGYARGEGVGIVVLKPVSKAIRDGNHIRAVIRATGSNHDGHTPIMTQPSGKAHAALIRQTYASVGLSLESTRFFEAHGTGTPTGDPIELGAVASVFKTYRSEEDPLIVGAVKSNIGHLEGASGVAGLIKTILILERGVIPPNTNFEKANPQLRLKEWNIHLPLEPMQWPSSGLRRASVNSFGLGGTNVHAVLDDAYHYCASRGLQAKHATNNVPSNLEPDQACSASDTSLDMPRLLVLSSADEHGVERLRSSYVRQFKTILQNQWNLAYYEDLIYTTCLKRTHFLYRGAFVIDSSKSIVESLDAPSKTVKRSPQGGIVFIFTGQGAQWLGMGKELLVYDVFRTSIQKADEYLASLGCSWSLIDTFQTPSHTINIDTPQISQTLCTVLQVALVDLLRSWRICPAANIGHSSGEIAAAYASQLITVESAWRIAYYRGLVSAKARSVSTSPGGMMAVGMTRHDFEQLEDTKDICVACFNSPSSLTLSGDKEQLTSLKQYLDERKVFNRILKIPVAYHSPRMLKVAEEYISLIGDLRAPSPDELESKPLFSTVTKTMLPVETANSSQYWAQNLISPVEFSETFANLLQHSDAKDFGLVVEIGPHSLMQRPVKDIILSLQPKKQTVQYISTMTLNRDAHKSLLETAGVLFSHGVDVNLENVNAPGQCKERRRLLIDLPAYDFNHETRHWLESRATKDYRLRENPPHQLLGTLNTSSTTFAPIWKNYLRQSDLDWTRDHQVDDVVSYPAAGMLVMAIEAIRQLSIGADGISAIRIKDVRFIKAMQVPDDIEGLETNIILQRQHDTDSKVHWYSFSITSYEYGTWQENCRGSIATESESADNQRQSKTSLNGIILSIYRKAINDCTDTVEESTLYSTLSSLGFGFGESFQTMHNIRYDKRGSAVITVRPNQWRSTSRSPVQPHLLHPTTLDAVIQSVLSALCFNESRTMTTIVPTAVHEIWLSGKILEAGETANWNVTTRARWSGKRTATSEISVIDQDSLDILIWARQFEMTAVGRSEKASTKPSNKLCFGIQVLPDLSLMDHRAITTYCSKIDTAEQHQIPLIEDLDLACYIYLNRLLKNLSDVTLSYFQSPWIKRYREWAEKSIHSIKQDSFLSDQLIRSGLLSSPDLQKEVLDRLSQDPDMQLYIEIGEHLTDMISGAQDPLAFIFQDNLIDRTYISLFWRGTLIEKLTRYLNASAHKNPSMNILEIGAGTGGGTSAMISALSDADKGGVARFSKYTFTDLSPSFFEKAKQKFIHHEERMEFNVLNIEMDPKDQGFVDQSYDMLIAVNVLHATSNLSKTLGYARSLLKKGGKLILLEACNPSSIRTTFMFGLLEGWWLAEEPFRQSGPLLHEQDWSDLLVQNGFSGADICLRDFDRGRNHIFSVIITTATEPSVPLTQHISPHSGITLAVVVSSKSGQQQEFATAFQNNIRNELQIDCEIVAADSTLKTFSHIVYLPELNKPVFADLSENLLNGLKEACTHQKNIFWITRSIYDARNSPTYGMVEGFARCLRAEVPSLNFVTLALEECSPNEDSMSKVRQIFNRWIVPGPQSEEEYVEKNGLLCVSRIIPDFTVDTYVDDLSGLSPPKLIRLKDIPSTPLELTISSLGMLNTLHFIPDEETHKPLNPDELIVEMKSVGINYYDLLVLLGQHTSDFTGLEGSGIVKALPSNYSGQLSIGSRVVGLFGNPYKTEARTNLNMVSHIEDSMPFSQAAGIPVAFVTAYVAIFEQARFSRGQTILIHSGAGGVGQAAIQLALLYTTVDNIFVTIGMEDKRNFLMARYGLPEENILSSKDPFLDDCLFKLTNGRGVDVVLNSLHGETLRRSLDCVVPFGYFIEISLKDAFAGFSIPMKALTNGVTIGSVNLATMMQKDPKRVGRVLGEVLQLVNSKQVASHIDSVYGIGAIESALRRLQSGQNMGKMVVEFRQEEEIMARKGVQARYSLDSAATYVISGLGGLGRSIARWLVKRGARHLLLLSRSGQSSPPAAGLVRELRQQGVHVELPACDVSDYDALSAIIESVASRMPPVKGCIQGAMVLKDGIFENMSLHSWNAAIRPKVDGSWNLHCLLPKGMDFFILLSSLNGVLATRSQSNYGAGNTYQDSLAHYRVSIGEKATSIDVGKMIGIGYVAEKQEDRHSFMLSLWNEIQEPSLHAVLDHSCNAAISKPQIAIGIAPQAVLAARDLEAPWWVDRPLARVLANISADENGSRVRRNDKTDRVSTLLEKAGSDAEQEDIALTALREKLSRTLATKPEDLDIGKSMNSYGADSLVAIEIKNWILSEVGVEMAVFEILDNASLETSARLIVERWHLKKEKISS